jgi:uncharacterized protein with HEPN domain
MTSALLMRFAEGKSFADYEWDEMLRSAVERQFEIIGETLSQLSRIDLDTAYQISEYRRIIAFRNILIHGYAQIDDRIVWDLLQTKLPLLRREAQQLLDAEVDPM